MQAAEAQQKQQQQQHSQQNQQAHPQAAQQSQVKSDVKPQTGFQQSATAAPPAFFQQSQPASKPFSTPSSYTTQPQATSSTSFSSTTQALTTNGTQVNYTVLSDDESSGHQSDDQQYEFGLDDFDGKSSKESNANKGLGGDFFGESWSPSPLPPPLAQRQVKPEPPTSSSSSSSMFPYSTGHPRQHISQQSQQPFAQTPPIQQSFYHHQALPISQPVTLNPALLFNNNNNNNHNQQLQVIAPHQLSHPPTPALPLQVNAISHAQGIPFTPQAAPLSNPAFIANQNGKGKRKTEVEVVVPQRREDSLGPGNAAKRKKTAEAGTIDGARQPLGTTFASSQQKQASDHAQAQSSSVGSSSTHSSVPSGPSAPTSTTSTPPGPLTQGQKIWAAMKKDMERILHQASRSPHKTVNRMFKLLEPFVSEPPDATSRQGSREAFTTEILCPADLRITLLEVIKDDTNDDFDVIFVVDPRATVLLHEWTRDLALIAKGKYKGGEDPKEIMKTSRSLMAVSCPFSTFVCFFTSSAFPPLLSYGFSPLTFLRAGVE